MRSIKHFICLFSITLFALPAFATWSIIVADPVTRQIGIAGASCTYSVYGIGAIVPGKGAVVVQAMSHPLARMKGVKMIMADAPPQEILEALKHPDFDPEEQQYAIVCVSDWQHPQVYTGDENPSFNGTATAPGISVQGNTLASDDVVAAVLAAALRAQKDSLPMEEVLMLALEGGAKAGGDKRCGERTASSAFITVFQPADDPKKPWLNLVVTGVDEKSNAVEKLRGKLNEWKKDMGR